MSINLASYFLRHNKTVDSDARKQKMRAEFEFAILATRTVVLPTTSTDERGANSKSTHRTGQPPHWNRPIASRARSLAQLCNPSYATAGTGAHYMYPDAQRDRNHQSEMGHPYLS
jgi:hypothetical protein